MAATCKNHIRTYLNEGHDVTTTQEMKEALLSYGGVKGVRVAILSSINETAELQKIPGISKLDNFQFIDRSLLAWRAYGIEKQKAYLEAKFNIGQSTGRKVDPDKVAKEMRRARGTDG